MKEGTKYVPLFYFEGETDHLKLKSETVNGWDLAYLKFCCKVSLKNLHCAFICPFYTNVKSILLFARSHFCFHLQVQGIRNELFSNEICSVVALEEIKGHFPAGTTFEDYWPAKGSIEALPNTRASAGAGNWTQKPAGQPNKMQVRLRIKELLHRALQGLLFDMGLCGY